MESLETTIIHNLLYNKEYFDKIIPYLKKDCFEDKAHNAFLFSILKLYKENGVQPTPEFVIPKVLTYKGSEDVVKRINDLIKQFKNPPREQNAKILLQETVKYLRYVFSTKLISELASKADDNHNITLEDITRLQEAVSFSIDNGTFYDYMAEFTNRIHHFKEHTDKFEFPLTALNRCTNGGMRRKSLSVVMASTGGGKSIFLCNAAAHLIKQGFNVFYVTCEMSVEEISKRIDANLLDVSQDSLMAEEVSESSIIQKMDKYTDRSSWGHLFIKEYPAGTATSLDIQKDIEELEHGNNIKIDVLVVDYLNLMATSRYSTKTANTYTIVKAIAEELRGIGQDKDIPILTATQSNRSALSKENRVDGGLEQVSDSIGLPQTADFMFNIIDVLDANWRKFHWRLLKILKNRWGDPSKEYIKVRLDTAFARFSDVEGEIDAMQEKPTLTVSNTTQTATTIAKQDIVSGTSKDSPVVNCESTQELF